MKSFTSAIALFVVAACGGGGSATPDASSAHDGGLDAPPGSSCPHPTVVYLKADGGTYTTSADDDSRSNATALITGTTTFPAYPNADFADVKACVVAGLAGLPFDVTDGDPGDVQHLELVFTTTYQGATNAPGVTTGGCTFNPNGIAVIAGSVGTGAAYHCGVALGLVGVMAGLSYTTDTHDFMSFGVCESGCSFKPTAETCTSGACMCAPGGTTEIPAARMATCR